MKIFVVGSSKNKFQELDDIREKFIVDEYHEQTNIDFLNPWYCELTGLYYLWQNCKDDIVGLEHYRRYFVNSDNALLSKIEILDLLKTSDIICKYHKFMPPPGYERNCYNWWLQHPYYKILLDVFVSRLDQADKFDEYLKTADHFAQCNMFICKKELINKYCEWLFNELAKMNKHDFENMPRIIGYIAEYIFSAWLHINNYKIHYQEVKEYK